MEPQFLRQLAQNKPEGAPSDYNAPFSYLEWKLRRPSITEKDAVYHYNRYLIEWFETNKEKKVSNQFILRQRYLYLLNQLQIYFSEEERNNWYNKVNLADEKELLLAIPFFAKKLKDIALYYLKLRKQLKNTKVKYNTVGSLAAIERELRTYFLKTLTTENTELSTSMQALLPAFEELRNSLTIEIEELYDDKSYFDHSDTVPVSAYFNLADQATSDYYKTKGITLSSAEWLFNALTLPVTASIEAYTNFIAGDIVQAFPTGDFSGNSNFEIAQDSSGISNFEPPEVDLYGTFIQKYLAENKFQLAVANVSSTIEVNDIDLVQGNNYFYYPYGIVDTSISIPRKLATVQLSSITINGATAGDDISTGDIMFVKNGDSLKSAWLYNRVYDSNTVNMNARLNTNSTTSFIFPYPGYGLSGQNFEWTGPSTASVGEYNFLSREYKTAVNEAYWSQTLSADTCDPILINNTTLVSGAPYPSDNSLFADQIYIREDRGKSRNSIGNVNGAWLYRFERTSIPIDSNQSNVILWPYTNVDPSTNLPHHLKHTNYRNVCQPVLIQNINKSSGIASSEFEYADKIYKLNKYSDSIENATECAWLSSSYDRVGNIQFVKQDGFNARFDAGVPLRFVWTGPNNTTLDTVFRSTTHTQDCPFAINSSSLSALEWQQCKCRQVYYSPLGHPGTTFQQYNTIADCIVEEESTNLDPFDFGSWLDNTNASINSSQKFAWYRTNSKHSWGDGRWVSNSIGVAPFTLKYGKTYIYRRANNNFDGSNLPHYSVQYSYRTANTVWMKGKKVTDSGTWYGLSAQSEMVLYPGDFLKYDRKEYTTSALISAQTYLAQSENRGSIWSSLDYIALDTRLYTLGGPTIYPRPVQTYFQTVYVSWPEVVPPLGITDSQYPAYPLTSLSAISAWDIIYDQDPTKRTRIYKGTKYTFPTNPVTPGLSGVWYSSDVSGFSFVPAFVGTYTIQVTAVRAGDGAVFAFTNIPKITAVDIYQEREVPVIFQNNSTGFLIEQPLNGWNYNTNSFNAASQGARPYWAVLYTEKNLSTQNKGIYSWGYPFSYVNNYLPNKNPVLSPLELQFGNVVEYFRKGYSFDWVQPITYKTYVNSPVWCQLSAVITNGASLSSIFESERKPTLNTFPQKTPTDIELSNILNGRPTEIYYYATNSFTWNVSVEVLQIPSTPTPELFFESSTPWTNLPNRFFPTIAQLPVLEEIYSQKDVGGYFIPQNLGASQYLNKDFTISLSSENLSGVFLGEDTNIHIGGRGHTKQDQPTLYKWSESNQWLKESATAEKLAGAVKKSLTKTLQTFVPYQENSEDSPVGLVNTRSRLTPWGGPYNDIWTDKNNEPKSFTGVRNVSAWTQSQVLKQNQQTLDYWVTDVFGNQYGLFKQLSAIPVKDRKTISGQLWTRTNDQTVFPSSISLSAVFQNMADEKQDQNLYLELVGTTIKSVDCFFDTLMIETPSTLTFARINYDYENSVIESSVDFVRSISLSQTLRFEQTWFFADIKKVVIFLTALSPGNDSFVPEFYELDLDTFVLQKVFPSTQMLTTAFQTALSNFSYSELSRGLLHYNPTSHKYLITYTGVTETSGLFVINITVNSYEAYNFEKIDIYVDP